MRLEVSIDFPSQEFSVNSSTVPDNIAITGQNRNELVCAQNQKNSADDDPSKTTSTMVDDRERLGTKNVN